jgi:hypothetical protein
MAAFAGLMVRIPLPPAANRANSEPPKHSLGPATGERPVEKALQPLVNPWQSSNSYDLADPGQPLERIEPRR